MVAEGTGNVERKSTLPGTASISEEDLQLDIADLDDVIHLERLLLPRVDTVAVEIGAVDTVEVFEEETVALEADQGMLPRGPDAVGRLLAFQVDVDRPLIG